MKELILIGDNMTENLMNSAHKATNKNYRDHYDDIFRKDKKEKEKEDEMSGVSKKDESI
jgi:hypothetical protein